MAYRYPQLRYEKVVPVTLCKNSWLETKMKRIFLFCLLMLASTSLFAQWEHWEVTRYPGIPLTIRVDSDVWGIRAIVLRDDTVTRRLIQGEVVLGDIRSTDNRINGIVTHVVRIRYEGNMFDIQASNLSPIGDERLPMDWITTPDAQKRWVISYCLDALHMQDRDTFLKYEKFWIENEMENIRRNIDSGEALRDDMWYNRNYLFSAGGLVFLESLVFFDAVIIMGGFETSVFFINNITPFYAGYKINMSGDREFALPEFVRNDPTIRLPFPLWEDRQSFDMIFITDGDYMDVYLDTLDNHFATFAKVDVVILEELERLVRTNTVDLSRITTWPRRADGTMDYPPPPVVSSNVPVQQVVDESIEIIYDVEDQESAIVQQNDDVPPMPFWLWFAIIGGVVAAGVVVLVVKRKR
jgi:hypothetical protein